MSGHPQVHPCSSLVLLQTLYASFPYSFVFQHDMGSPSIGTYGVVVHFDIHCDCLNYLQSYSHQNRIYKGLLSCVFPTFFRFCSRQHIFHKHILHQCDLWIITELASKSRVCLKFQKSHQTHNVLAIPWNAFWSHCCFLFFLLSVS